jgi:hypothetical protein
MAIRRGDVPLDEALTEIDDIERRLLAAVEASPLREEPDYESVNAFLIETHRQAWGWDESG